MRLLVAGRLLRHLSFSYFSSKTFNSLSIIAKKNMKIEVEVICKELIKPSSPTPDHLRHYQLSFLDQIEPPVIIPCLQFYNEKSNTNNLETCKILKQSLRQALTILYPLAGRIENNFYLNCNDEGLLLVEAHANCQLSEILKDRNPSNNRKFIPIQPDEVGDLAAFCQITFFNCGGFSISFGVSHKIGDALSMFIFVSTWSAIARGNTNVGSPSFGWANLFPPTNISTLDPAETSKLKENIMTRRFVFDASTIEALIAKYTVNGVRPSRVMAVTAFIWCRFMATTQGEGAKNKLYSVFNGLDLRGRMEPRLPKLSFGNLVCVAMAEADMEAKDDCSYGIVKRIKDSIRNLNVKTLQNSDGQSDLLKKIVEEYGKKEVVNFTSLCNFPIYEGDFGWGKPLWVTIVPPVIRNLVILMDTKEERGIEALINLREGDMAKFVCDKEFLAHVSA